MPSSFDFQAVKQETSNPPDSPLRFNILVKCPAGVLPLMDERGFLIALYDPEEGFTLPYKLDSRRPFPVVDVWDTPWLVRDSADIEINVSALVGRGPRHPGTVTVSKGGGGGPAVARGKKKGAFQLLASYNSYKLPDHIKKIFKRK